MFAVFDTNKTKLENHSVILPLSENKSWLLQSTQGSNLAKILMTSLSLTINLFFSLPLFLFLFVCFFPFVTENLAELSQLVEGNSEGEYIVERVLQKVVRKGKTLYEVKWLGWDEKDNTYEPREVLEGNAAFIEFKRSGRNKGKGKSKKQKL